MEIIFMVVKATYSYKINSVFAFIYIGPWGEGSRLRVAMLVQFICRGSSVAVLSVPSVFKFTQFWSNRCHKIKIGDNYLKLEMFS